MKYFSDMTNKVYESVEELEKAEKELTEKLENETKAKAEAEAKREQALAEAKAKKEALAKERGDRAKEVEDAIKELNDLRKSCAKQIEEKQKQVNKLVDNFVKDYNYFHMSYKSSDDMPNLAFTSFTKPWSSFFDNFFKNF